MTEWLHFPFSLSCIGEGNGSPLQCSCLESPGDGEPGRLQSVGSLRVGQDWATSLSLFTFMHWIRKWQPTPVFLPGESWGRGAWRAAVCGVAQSRTRLKRLSSSTFPSNTAWAEAASSVCWVRKLRPKKLRARSGSHSGRFQRRLVSPCTALLCLRLRRSTQPPEMMQPVCSSGTHCQTITELGCYCQT